MHLVKAKLHVHPNGVPSITCHAISQSLNGLVVHARIPWIKLLLRPTIIHATHASRWAPPNTHYVSAQTNTSSPDSLLSLSSITVAKMWHEAVFLIVCASSALASPYIVRERSIVTEIKDSYDFVIVGGE